MALISTPMNVPCIASARRILARGSAARRIACQAKPRETIAAHISAQPITTQDGLEVTSALGDAPDADPLDRQRRHRDGGQRHQRDHAAAHAGERALASRALVALEARQAPLRPLAPPPVDRGDAELDLGAREPAGGHGAAIASS